MNFTATGSRLEPRIDQAIEWSFPKKGSLELGNDAIRFGEWVIPNSEVQDAVLNTERYLIKKQQSLMVDCGSDKYMFGLYDTIEDDYNFPFEVRITSKRSFVGKLILVGIALFLLNLAIDIVPKFI